MQLLSSNFISAEKGQNQKQLYHTLAIKIVNMLVMGQNLSSSWQHPKLQSPPYHHQVRYLLSFCDGPFYLFSFFILSDILVPVMHCHRLALSLWAIFSFFPVYETLVVTKLNGVQVVVQIDSFRSVRLLAEKSTLVFHSLNQLIHFQYLFFQTLILR